MSAPADTEAPRIVDGPLFLRAAVEKPTFEHLRASGVRKLLAYIDQLTADAQRARDELALLRAVEVKARAAYEAWSESWDSPGHQPMHDAFAGLGSALDDVDKAEAALKSKTYLEATKGTT